MIKKHLGVILKPSEIGFDSRGSAFAYAFRDEEEDPTVTYLYYSGTEDVGWLHSSIGLAKSTDGIRFTKLKGLNPLISGNAEWFNSKQSVTPCVMRMNNNYYMFFACCNSNYERKIGLAFADDPCGPWKTLRVIAKAERFWEGCNIDLGPNIVKLSENEVLLYYSNADMKKPFRYRFTRRFLCRRIGILKVKINSPMSVETLKYHGNPLKHLNGPKGSPNESLFCPGGFSIGSKYFLLPSMSTYFTGFPYPQYIGLTTDSSPYFKNANNILVLINGLTEKNSIIPQVKSEIALDTASVIVEEDRVLLYYSVMDRHDKKWKLALTIFDRKLLEDLSWK